MRDEVCVVKNYKFLYMKINLVPIFTKLECTDDK